MKKNYAYCRESLSTVYYNLRNYLLAREFERMLPGAVILLIIAPLIVSIAGGSLIPFSLMMVIESSGALWGILKFKMLPIHLPPLNPIPHTRPVEIRRSLKKAA